LSKPIIRVQRLQPVLDADIPLPAYQTSGAAGADICANNPEPIRLLPGERQLVPTGLSMAIPEGWEVQIRPRSGLAWKHGIGLVNAPGTIDSDYRGEIKVILINLSDTPFEITRGDRIAQMVVAPAVQCQFDEVSSLDASERGEGGFGHTGV